MRPRTLAILALSVLTSLAAIAATGDEPASRTPAARTPAAQNPAAQNPAAQDMAPVGDPADPKSDASKDDTAAAGDEAEAAAAERAVSILYTIHNSGYVEPCG